jgi:CO/xanthine dehydrogenase Mo-binding subunit
MTSRIIGQSRKRLEDPPLVTGQGRFASDISFPDQLAMRVVRSGHAHGRIISIDASEALALPGVFAVWTADDVAALPPIDVRLTNIKGLAPYRQYVLARDKVRYVGEPVAVVFASDAYTAEDAADLVTIDIEELPAVLDAAGDTGEFAPGLATEVVVSRKATATPRPRSRPHRTSSRSP